MRPSEEHLISFAAKYLNFMKQNPARLLISGGCSVVKSVSIGAIVCVLAPVLFLVTANAALPSAYNITDLGASLGTNSHASGINNNGEAVGYYQGASGVRAFLYSGGAFVDLGSLGGASQYALNINSSGQVVGFGEATDGIRAFFFDNGAMRNLGSLGGLSSYAWGLNDIGQIVGHVTFTNGVAGYIYDGNGLTNLGSLGGTESYGFGVNMDSFRAHPAGIQFIW